MSTESEDERIERWARNEARKGALHRRRMRWWKHAREYLSLKRLVSGNLLCSPSADTAIHRTITTDAAIQRSQLPDHPPWSAASNWWPRHVHWSRTRAS